MPFASAVILIDGCVCITFQRHICPAFPGVEPQDSRAYRRALQQAIHSISIAIEMQKYIKLFISTAIEISLNSYLSYHRPISINVALAIPPG
jgi:hypothetical protein